MLGANKVQVLALALGMVVATMCCSSLSSCAPTTPETEDLDKIEVSIFGESQQEDKKDEDKKDEDKPAPIKPAAPGSIPVDDARLMELRAQCRQAAELRVAKDAERSTGRKGPRKTHYAKPTDKVTRAPLVLSPAQEAERDQMRDACARAAGKRVDNSARRGVRQ